MRSPLYIDKSGKLKEPQTFYCGAFDQFWLKGVVITRLEYQLPSDGCIITESVEFDK